MNPLQELVIDVSVGQSLGEKTCFTDDFIVLERLRSMIVLESCIAHDLLIPPRRRFGIALFQLSSCICPYAN
jgi:hypothetical protein